MTIGIYKITNKETDQMYIGKSINIEDRFRQHKKPSKRELKHSRIDKAINKHGESNFTFEIIYCCKEQYLNRFEKLYIKKYNTFKDRFNYNLTNGGDGFCSGENHPNYGKNFSGENNNFYGKHHTDETCRKISEAHKGKKRPEHSEKIKGENHPLAKYNNLWNIQCVKYEKNIMFRCNREPNPCNCFRLKYNGKEFPIGCFIDPISPKIINDLIDDKDVNI